MATLARLTRLLAAVGLLAALAVPAAADQAPLPGDTRGNVQIAAVRYNVKGVDKPSNAKYEWVALKNIGLASVDLTGWTIEDATGNTFEFKGDSAWDVPATEVVELDPILAPGRTVVVHTGRNTLPSANIAGAVNVYWGRYNHVWANSGKEAVSLYNGSTRIDRGSYDDNTITF
ncbi:lamin tail domain-containing protein [Streptosporangiaceae bacterium NEAU-GS5]|nr:lamin tail domain-containing protein [Streptosporangiaceae bacterium NEAU-GS5]